MEEETNKLYIFRVWNINILYLLHLSLSHPYLIYRPHPNHKGVNDFPFLIRHMSEEEANQLCLILCLKLEYGIVTYCISLLLSIFRFTNPYLASCSQTKPQEC